MYSLDIDSYKFVILHLNVLYQRLYLAIVLIEDIATEIVNIVCMLKEASAPLQDLQNILMLHSLMGEYAYVYILCIFLPTNASAEHWPSGRIPR
jgi:hypothetical protein